MGRYVLVKSGLDASKECFHSLFSLGAACLACDVQQADNGIFEVIIFDGLLQLLLLLCVGGTALLMGSHHLFYVLVGRPPRVLSMCQVGGGVYALHMTGSSLHCLLPGGHHHHHMANIVRINARHITKGLLCLDDNFAQSLEVPLL